MIQFPIQDAQAAMKNCLRPPPGKCHTCINRKEANYAHNNKALGLYYAFYCTKCKQWFCGQCYQIANSVKSIDEVCPFVKCGPVTYSAQIQRHEWFPVKPTILSTVKTMPLPIAPSTPVVGIEYTRAPTPPTRPDSPVPTQPDPFMKSLTDIQNLYTTLETELKQCKGLVDQVQTYKDLAEKWESKYKNLKRKLQDVINDDSTDNE